MSITLPIWLVQVYVAFWACWLLFVAVWFIRIIASSPPSGRARPTTGYDPLPPPDTAPHESSLPGEDATNERA